MKVVKLFTVGIVGLFIFSTLLSLLIPSAITVNKSVIINNIDSTKIYNRVANFNNWQNWHPFFVPNTAAVSYKTDTACTINYNDKSIQLNITRETSTNIDFIISQNDKVITTNSILITTMPQLNQTKVDWLATTKLKWYPWEKFYGIFIDKLTGTNYEIALVGLKKDIEGIK